MRGRISINVIIHLPRPSTRLSGRSGYWTTKIAKGTKDAKRHHVSRISRFFRAFRVPNDWLAADSDSGFAA
jgi:hypothetical protein